MVSESPPDSDGSEAQWWPLENFSTQTNEQHVGCMELEDYAHGRLRHPVAAAVVIAHIHQCEECRQRLMDERTWPLAEINGELHADVVALAEYAESAVESGAIPALEQHLGECEDCRRLLEEMRIITGPITLDDFGLKPLGS